MRLIDADALLAEVREQGVLGSGHSDSEREDDVCDMIDHAPTVDAIEVVRCKDCVRKRAEYWVETDRFVVCSRYNISKNENGFCDYGERKDGDE